MTARPYPLRPPTSPCPCGRMTISDCAGECSFPEADRRDAVDSRQTEIIRAASQMEKLGFSQADIREAQERIDQRHARKRLWRLSARGFEHTREFVILTEVEAVTQEDALEIIRHSKYAPALMVASRDLKLEVVA